MSFLVGLKAKAIAAGLVVLALLAALAKAFYAGRRSAEVDSMKDQLGNVEVRNEVDSRIDRAPPVERRRLRDKWTRR